jgi:hypothetical protein
LLRLSLWIAGGGRLRTARDILDERYACSEIDSEADMRAGMVSLRAQVSAERDR